MHAIAALIDCVDPPAGTWLVADGEAVSTPELVRRLAAALGVAPRLLPAPVPLLRIAGALTGRGAQIARLAGSLEVDVSPLADRIGPLPYTLDEGLAATARCVACAARHLRLIEVTLCDRSHPDSSFLLWKCLTER